MKFDKGQQLLLVHLSRPARGAWVEIINMMAELKGDTAVAPRKGRVG